MVIPKEFAVIVNQKTAKGKETAATIMAEAYELLAEEGAANFSMLSLAKRVGIARGNLQYYFPLQKDLIVALLWNFRHQAHNNLNQAVEDASKDPKEKFSRFIDYVLSNEEDPKDNAVIWNIWAMCANNTELFEILEGHYAFFSEFIADMISDMNPDLPKGKAETIAQMLISMLEGSSLFLTRLNKGKTGKKELKKMLHDTIMSLAGQGHQTL